MIFKRKILTYSQQCQPNRILQKSLFVVVGLAVMCLMLLMNDPQNLLYQRAL